LYEGYSPLPLNLSPDHLVSAALELPKILFCALVPSLVTGRLVDFCAVSMIIGNAIIYIFGAGWLSRFVGWDAVLSAGVVPFLAGDVLKIALATVLLPTGWRFIGRAAQ